MKEEEGIHRQGSKITLKSYYGMRYLPCLVEFRPIMKEE
jgi:hypothetical protein